MKFGFTVMADIDEIGFFSHAEALGYDSVWVTDSQMLFSDCYAVLALAARETRRLHIGPGTAICGTRIPPVQVAAMATLNRLAPGRVFLGIGTGHTAMRSMGQRPMKMAEYAEYLRVLSALLRGKEVDYTLNGVTQPIGMLMHEWKYMNLEPKIPLYVSGFGPRAMALAGEYGDGLVFAIPPRGVPVAQALAHARQGASRINRDMTGFRNAALTSVAVLQPGEAVELRSHQGGAWSKCAGECRLFLRRCAEGPRRAASFPGAHLEAVLRAGGSDTAGDPLLPHARVPLHEAASRRGGTHRCAVDPRYLPDRYAGRTDHADTRTGT